MTRRRSLSATDIMLACGALLIIVGVFVLASTGWQSFSSASRIMTALVPLAALYAIGFSSRGKESHRTISQATILTGSIILPIVLGIIAYQSGLYSYMDSTLVFGVSLISLVWYAFLEFSLRERWHAVGTIVTSCVMAVSFGSTVGMAAWGYSLMAVVLAYFFLSLSRHYAAEEATDPLQLSVTYGSTGAILGLAGLFFLPLNLVDRYGGHQEWSTVDATLLYVAVSAILFGTAVAYSKEWRARKLPLDLTLRQVSENASALALTLPAILIGLGSDSTADILLLIILGVISVILSAYVRVSYFRLLGFFAAGLGLVKLLFFAVTQVGAGWPIVLLVIGFILIGIAYFAQQGGSFSRLGNLLKPSESESSLFGLGVNPEPRRLHGGHEDEVVEDHEHGITFTTKSATFISHGSPLSGSAVLWAIGGFVLLMLIIRFLSSSSTSY